MSDGHRVEFAGITKSFGDVAAVTDFSARAEPGVVTGFLGPNGAGKTTSLRILLGLVQATSGRATIGGTAYRDLANPLASVGSVLEAASFHPGRTAAAHLKIYAQAASLPVSRVDAVLGTVGLGDVGGRKVGGFSLGMRQRLGLAFALLGDPGVLVLDEPSNGLDPEGIIWMRSLLRDLAAEGRTVLVSSHLLGEVQQTVDELIIIAHGRLVFQGATAELSDGAERGVTVDAPDRAALAAALSDAGFTYTTLRTGLGVGAVDPARIGEIALKAGVPLSSLQRRGASLEEVFLELVNGIRVHPSASGEARVAALSAGTGAVSVPAESAAPGISADAEPVSADAASVEAVSADAASADAAAASDRDADGTADAAAPAVVTDPTPSTAIAVIPRESPVAAGDPAASDAALRDRRSDDDGAPRGPFTVASTGVIDIVASSDADAADAPHPAERPYARDGLASGPTAVIGPDGAVAVSDERRPSAEDRTDAPAEGDQR